MHSVTIETDRLLLRALSPKDAEAAFVWLSDPEVNRYVRYTLYKSMDEARAWLNYVTDNPNEFGVVRKEDGLLIGACSLFISVKAANRWELGYNLRRDCWGQGYATELAKALLRHAQETYGAQDFVAAHAVGNPASGRVMEKCGFTYSHDGESEKFDGSVHYYVKYYTLHVNSFTQTKFNAVQSVLNQLDPYGLLASGAPADEFESEARAISRLITSRSSVDEIAQAIANVMNQAFDQHDSETTYTEAALAIHNAFKHID